MAFNLFKKKKSGSKSTIAHFQSPYLKKPSLPERALRRQKKRGSMVIEPARIKSGKSNLGRKILWTLLILVIVGGGSYIVFFSHSFDLKKWDFKEGDNIVEPDEILNQMMEKEKNKNLLFINENAIISQILANYPQVKNVEVKKIFPQKIRIEIENYPLVANLTDRVGEVRKKFLINSNGYLTQENTEDPALPYIEIQTAEMLALKSTAMKVETLEYILKSIRLFEEKFSMKVLDAQYLSREREVHLKTEKFFSVWIDLEKDLTKQLEKLKNALVKLDIYHLSLEYIDLRISGTDNEKVIYKLRKK